MSLTGNWEYICARVQICRARSHYSYIHSSPSICCVDHSTQITLDLSRWSVLKMLLFELPPEIVQNIFAQIGPSWFRKDQKRLTISRAWYNVAVEACYRDFTFDQIAMYCLISGPSFAKNSTMIQRVTETAVLELLGHPNWTPSYKDLSPPTRRANNSSPSFLVLPSFETIQGGFYEMLRRSQRLRRLVLLARREEFPTGCLFAPDEDHLLSRSIQNLCRIKSLRSLTLDLYGFPFLPHGEIHFCTVVSELFTTLYSLKVRLPLICTKTLSVADDDKRDLKLRDLVINLTISWKEGCDHEISRQCEAASKMPFFSRPLVNQKLHQFCNQARALQARMPKPNRVSIIMRTKPFWRDPDLPAWKATDEYARDDWAKRSLDQGFGPGYQDLLQSTVEATQDS